MGRTAPERERERKREGKVFPRTVFLESGGGREKGGDREREKEDTNNIKVGQSHAHQLTAAHGRLVEHCVHCAQPRRKLMN